MNDSTWKKVLADFEKAEEGREKIVLLSRTILQHSKKAIYAAHRHDLAEAKKYIDVMKPLLKQIKLGQKKASADAIHSARIAEQEFVEAVCMYHVLQGKHVPSHKALGVDAESYLLGLCDLVGELGRAGVHKIINNDYQTAVKLQQFVHELYGKLMHLNARNGELRKKIDGVKWELKKMEDVLLQLKITGKI